MWSASGFTVYINSSINSDNLPYAYCEQIGKEIRDISDEIPFDIPDSWEWCRVSSILQLINGDRGKNYPSKEKLHNEGDIPFISAINMKNGTVNKDNLLYVDREQYENLNSGKLIQNDLVVCIRGSLGKFCIYPYFIGAIASSLVILRKYGDLSNDYLALYLQS
ncbi:MAG: restriction endonuclease subunit S, partial [Ruminococcus sp.]